MTNETAKKVSGQSAMKWSLIFIFMLIVSGCGKGPEWTREEPDVFLDGYLQATESMAVDVMWEYLSAETQKKLEAEAAAFNENPAHGKTRHGYDMLRTGHVLSSTREYKKIEVASSDKETATVNIVKSDGSVIPVRLHRENSRWAIDLPL